MEPGRNAAEKEERIVGSFNNKYGRCAVDTRFGVIKDYLFIEKSAFGVNLCVGINSASANDLLILRKKGVDSIRQTNACFNKQNKNVSRAMENAQP